MKPTFIFICYTLAVYLNCSKVSANHTLTLATTEWCPYTCDYKGNKHGFVGEKLENLLAKYDIKLEVVSYPWSRAINLAQRGQVDGLLTASHSEAPDLLFSDTPIGSYQMCFFTTLNNEWTYGKNIDLGNRSLGVIQNYGYGEPLDSYIQHNPNNLVSITGAETTKRLIDVLLKQRADIIVEDSSVLYWRLEKSELDKKLIRKAGCLAKQPFYLALHPSDRNAKLMKILNKEFTNSITELK